MGKVSRRDFLRLAAGGGGAAMAVGLGVKHPDNLIPYVVPPENVRPGVITWIATTCRECPAGCGMHVAHRDGRVVKVEGNPDHPVNRGGLCARGQSALQGLYDPDRVRRVVYQPRGGERRSFDWPTAIGEIGGRLRDAKGQVFVISDLQTGALAEVTEGFAKALGSQPPAFFEPFNYNALLAAHHLAFGIGAIPDYRIDQCDFLISFGVDFLETWISPVQFAQRFAEMRTVRDGRRGRFIYVGPRLSMTAASADEFIQVPPEAMLGVALAMLKAVVEQQGDKADEKLRAATGGPAADLAASTGVPPERIAELARAFLAARGSIALAGSDSSSSPLAAVTAVAAALMNHAAGRIGQTVDFSRTHALGGRKMLADLGELLLHIGPESVVIVLNANPAFTNPGFTTGLARETLALAGTVVYLGTMMDETAELATWVLPIDSPLESWGDYEPQAGINCLMQPTMGRVFDTRAAGDILLDLARAAGRPLSRAAHEKPVPDFCGWLRARWQELGKRVDPGQPFDEFWPEALRAGGAWESPPPAATVNLNEGPWRRGLISEVSAELAKAKSATEAAEEAALWLWPSIFLFDGRHANRGWLQEAPDPTTHIVWGSWVDIHPAKAAALGISDGDVIEIASKSGKVEAPARVTEDVHESTVALAFGQGHTALGRNAKDRGANAFSLLGWEGQRSLGRVTVRRTGRREEPVLASSGVQEQFDREILLWMPLEKLRTMKPGEGRQLILPLPEGYRPEKDIYKPHYYKEHRWAMAVDLDRCIGCGACAVACYAENNIAVVGADEVRRGRRMHWLQMAPYREEGASRRLGFLPLMCQHCDAAPCEAVCPVFASVHNDEGLNSQVYNRCIGTRYCSNNCPYKVRRFNWLNWRWEKPLDWQLNPDVTVRVRGVMEKCTFCIQRIRAAESLAKREGRKVRDGEIQPACAQSCPTRAYTFGDLLDPASEVTRLTRTDPRRYHVLEELNTKPAVTYLARIKSDGVA